MDLEKESKACVEVYLQTKKAEIKKDMYFFFFEEDAHMYEKWIAEHSENM